MIALLIKFIEQKSTSVEALACLRACLYLGLDVKTSLAVFAIYIRPKHVGQCCYQIKAKNLCEVSLSFNLAHNYGSLKWHHPKCQQPLKQWGSMAFSDVTARVGWPAPRWWLSIYWPDYRTDGCLLSVSFIFILLLVRNLLFFYMVFCLTDWVGRIFRISGQLSSDNWKDWVLQLGQNQLGRVCVVTWTLYST